MTTSTPRTGSRWWGVDWYDASAYARFAGERLPTADEWELAARGGTKQLYPWGDDFKATDCCSGEGPDQVPVKVMSYPRDCSPVGVYDLAGNVLEWTAEPWEDSSDMIIRGGCFDRDCQMRAVTYVRDLRAGTSGKRSGVSLRGRS